MTKLRGHTPSQSEQRLSYVNEGALKPVLDEVEWKVV